jgi:hypothetical protein
MNVSSLPYVRAESGSLDRGPLAQVESPRLVPASDVCPAFLGLVRVNNFYFPHAKAARDR